MKGKKTRRNYIINPARQTKFVAFTMIPVIIMGLFSVHLWIQSANWMYWAAEQKPLETMMRIQYATYSSETVKDSVTDTTQINRLERDFSTIQETVEAGYMTAIEDYNKAAWLSFVVLVTVFVLSGFFALLQSHRISGAVYRLKCCAEMLSEGHDIPPIRLRKNDEFKELAESLEKLRSRLKEKGVLE